MAVLKPMKLNQFTPVRDCYFFKKKKKQKLFFLPIRKVIFLGILQQWAVLSCFSLLYRTATDKSHQMMLLNTAALAFYIKGRHQVVLSELRKHIIAN